MEKSYSVIANCYDKFSHNDCDYVSWSQYLYVLAKKHNVKKVVDIACGTGKMTVLLAKRGLQTIGVDNSSEMLSVASQKVRGVFVLQDMQKLALPGRCDMAVCVNDGVNYLPPQNLVAFFQRVGQNIKSGAPFVFDISSQYKLTNVVGNNVFYIDDDNQTLLWTNSLKDNSLTMNLTLFDGDGQNYQRFDESHTQYVYSTQDICQALEQAGFSLVEVTSEYGKPLTDDALRITFYAVKK